MNPFSLCSVADQASAGTMALSVSSTRPQNLSCSAPNSTATRTGCELKLDGTCSTACLTISCTRSFDTGRSLLSA